MKLLERVKVYLGVSQVDVYCQACGYDITDKGSVVEIRQLPNGSEVRKTYCPNAIGVRTLIVTSEILIHGMSKTDNGSLYNPREVQRAIAKGEITHYSPLERMANE